MRGLSPFFQQLFGKLRLGVVQRSLVEVPQNRTDRSRNLTSPAVVIHCRSRSLDYVDAAGLMSMNTVANGVPRRSLRVRPRQVLCQLGRTWQAGISRVSGLSSFQAAKNLFCTRQGSPCTPLGNRQSYVRGAAPNALKGQRSEAHLAS